MLAGCLHPQVKVGSCDDSPDEVAEVLAAAGDCVLVQKIGFTLTFYRDKGLPPPPPLKPAAAAKPRAAKAGAAKPAASAAPPATAGPEGEEAGAEEAGRGGERAEVAPVDADEVDAELAVYLLENEDAFSDSDSEGEEEEEEVDYGRPNSSRRQAAAARAAREKRPPPPPEFTVIG